MASDHERLLALTAFDDTKAGVKGLVDAGVTAVPSIFHHPPECLPAADAELHHLTIPVIDLASDSRVALVAQVKAAAQAVGFFQVVNHDVPDDLLAEMLASVQRVGRALFELLSEALGLDPSYLEEETMCLDRVNIGGHYYPACPEPHLTLGTSRHSDASLLTVLLQDTVGGLQVLVDDDKWVDVPAVPGALVVNVGDYLQLMSNNRFKSVEHRVVANSVDSRVSVACFIAPTPSSARVLAPIVTGDGAVARYRSTTVDDMFRYYRNRTKALNGTSALQHFTI
uniref:1-aminocyclopropane-1-carboxylate oxidase-1-like protein n=1 Tax=Aegilops tauschii TaxID=37682 RepID=M8BGH3_AEGTA